MGESGFFGEREVDFFFFFFFFIFGVERGGRAGFEAFGVEGPGGLDLGEVEGMALLEIGGEGFEAEKAVFDGCHG